MSIERIKWHMKGFRDLRRSDEVMRDLIARGQRIADAAGAGFEQTPRTGKTRARVSVAATTPQAKRENAEQNTLIRVLDAGR